MIFVTWLNTVQSYYYVRSEDGQFVIVHLLVLSTGHNRMISIHFHRLLVINQHQRLWSRGYDSRLGLSKDIKCERSQVRVLATALVFAFWRLSGGVRGGCGAQGVQERVDHHGMGAEGEQRDEIALREKWRC